MPAPRYIATQTRRVFGVPYEAGDLVDVSGLNSRAIDRALDQGLIDVEQLDEVIDGGRITDL